LAVISGSRRRKGSGGVTAVRAGVWRTELETPQQPGEQRRRVSKTVYGNRLDGERAVPPLDVGYMRQTTAINLHVPTTVAASLAIAASPDSVSVVEEVRIAIADRLRELGLPL
jgi:hypothetical protein